jgi:hypothetical protein
MSRRASGARVRRGFAAAAGGTLIATTTTILTIATSGAALADRFEPVGGGWELYVNERFGTSLTFPASIFTPDEPPANGDGRKMHSSDATLEVYTWHNVDGETAGSLKNRLLGSDGYTDVTYSPSGQSWLVLSGYRGDNIFYEKYFFQNDMVSGFGMEFPEAAKPRYAPIVERIEDSFEAGRPD